MLKFITPANRECWIFTHSSDTTILFRMLNKIKIYIYNLIHGRLYFMYRAMTDPNSNLLFNKNVLNNTKTGTHTKLHPPYKSSDSDIGDYTYIAENSRISHSKI